MRRVEVEREETLNRLGPHRHGGKFGQADPADVDLIGIWYGGASNHFSYLWDAGEDAFHHMLIPGDGEMVYRDEFAHPEEPFDADEHPCFFEDFAAHSRDYGDC